MNSAATNFSWPLSGTGQLPSDLFDKEFLRRTLSIGGVSYWRCTSKSVRKGLKGLGKKYGVEPLDLPSKLDTSDRDAELVFAVCNNAEARAHLNNLEIIVESTGHGSGKRNRSPKVRIFPKTIWDLAYLSGDDKAANSFAKWSLENGEARPELGEGTFFGGKSLKAAIAKADCPVSSSSLIFCRGILLFAALLAPEERRELIDAAISCGADSLREVLIEPIGQNTSMAQSLTEFIENRESSLPRLIREIENEPDVTAVFPKETTETKLLKERIAFEAAKAVDARSVFGSKVLEVMAAITDPSTGLSDPSVVGRNAASIVQFISANLESIQTRDDLSMLLSNAMPSGASVEVAVSFIASPSNMVGHFKRVREIAQEHLLIPLVRDGKLDKIVAKAVLSDIESGVAHQKVIKLFYDADRGQTKLERQHELQLSRYLQQARKLIADGLKREVGRIDIRQAKLSDELANIIAQMATEAGLGQRPASSITSHVRLFDQDRTRAVRRNSACGSEADTIRTLRDVRQ